MNRDNEWDMLGTQWRAQALPSLDTGALQRHARRTGWRLRALAVLDWGSVLATIAIVVHAFGRVERFEPVHVVVLVFLAVALGYARWTHRLRRGLYRDTGLSPGALLALLQARSRASLRFWRMNDRVTVALLLVLLALAGAAAAGLAALPLRGILLGIMVNTPLVVAGLLVSRARRRRLHARIADLQAWQDALRDP